MTRLGAVATGRRWGEEAASQRGTQIRRSNANLYVWSYSARHGSLDVARHVESLRGTARIMYHVSIASTRT